MMVKNGEEIMSAAEGDLGSLPLAGITVIDFGQIFQGPYATLLLAKAGANVIKIEPLTGEPLRRRAAPRRGKARRCPLRCSIRTSAR
jgi:crotonobetainyl-CoA:carnitine CoA-transferase CaiB-like acyl-CoA transferase